MCKDNQILRTESYQSPLVDNRHVIIFQWIYLYITEYQSLILPVYPSFENIRRQMKRGINVELMTLLLKSYNLLKSNKGNTKSNE